MMDDTTKDVADYYISAGGQPVEVEFAGVLNSEHFHIKGANAGDGTSFRYGRSKINLSPSGRRSPRSSSGFCGVHVFTLLAALTVVMLIALCRRSLKGVGAHPFVSRRLSSNEDSSESGHHLICVDSSEDEDTLEHARKRQRLDGSLFEGRSGLQAAIWRPSALEQQGFDDDPGEGPSGLQAARSRPSALERQGLDDDPGEGPSGLQATRSRPSALEQQGLDDDPGEGPSGLQAARPRRFPLGERDQDDSSELFAARALARELFMSQRSRRKATSKRRYDQPLGVEKTSFIGEADVEGRLSTSAGTTWTGVPSYSMPSGFQHSWRWHQDISWSPLAGPHLPNVHRPWFSDHYRWLQQSPFGIAGLSEQQDRQSSQQQPLSGHPVVWTATGGRPDEQGGTSAEVQRGLLEQLMQRTQPGDTQPEQGKQDMGQLAVPPSLGHSGPPTTAVLDSLEAQATGRQYPVRPVPVRPLPRMPVEPGHLLSFGYSWPYYASRLHLGPAPSWYTALVWSGMGQRAPWAPQQQMPSRVGAPGPLFGDGQLQQQPLDLSRRSVGHSSSGPQPPGSSGEGSSLLRSLLSRGPQYGDAEAAGSADSSEAEPSGASRTSTPDDEEIGRHPFCRVPRVRGGTPNVRVFAAAPNVLLAPSANPVVLLDMVREELTKEEVSTAELRELCYMARRLVAYCLRFSGVTTRVFPSRDCARLGLRFLIMDAVTKIMQLLGETVDPSNTGWRAFVSSINNSVRYSVNYNPAAPRLFAMRLSVALGNTLQIFKLGRRPSAREIFDMKRMMLCSPLTIAYFRKPEFDPWRNDHREWQQARFSSG